MIYSWQIYVLLCSFYCLCDSGEIATPPQWGRFSFRIGKTAYGRNLQAETRNDDWTWFVRDGITSAPPLDYSLRMVRNDSVLTFNTLSDL